MLMSKGRSPHIFKKGNIVYSKYFIHYNPARLTQFQELLYTLQVFDLTIFLCNNLNYNQHLWKANLWMNINEYVNSDFTSMKIYHILRKTVFLHKCYKILFCTCNPHVLLILKILHKCVIQIYTLNWIHQSFPGGPHEPTFACQSGCYPWHGAPFNVPADGHNYIRMFSKGFYYEHITIMCVNCVHRNSFKQKWEEGGSMQCEWNLHFIFCCTP